MTETEFSIEILECKILECNYITYLLLLFSVYNCTTHNLQINETTHNAIVTVY